MTNKFAASPDAVPRAIAFTPEQLVEIDVNQKLFVHCAKLWVGETDLVDE